MLNKKNFRDRCPGVITQQVSCELGVTHLQEGFLGIILYVTFAFTVGLSGYLSERFGRRLIMLIALYTSILFTVFCAIVPNYYTLLLSRALTGLCVGLNDTTIGVYFAESVSSRKAYKIGTSLQSISIPLGGGCIALLGYAMLDWIGWRPFILITSIPFSLPPLKMLHCCLEDSVPGTSNVECTEEEDAVPARVENFRWRVLSLTASSFIGTLQGYGAILLLPALIRKNNEDLDLGEQLTNHNTNELLEDMQCANTVHGSQLLIIALITGVANILGRVAGYFIRGKGRFRTVHSILATMLTVSYALLVFQSGLVITVVAMGTATFIYSMMTLEFWIIAFDQQYFGSERVATAIAISWTIGMFGAVVGTSFAVFMGPDVAVMLTFVLSFIMIGVICTFKDKQ